MMYCWVVHKKLFHHLTCLRWAFTPRHILSSYSVWPIFQTARSKFLLVCEQSQRARSATENWKEDLVNYVERCPESLVFHDARRVIWEGSLLPSRSQEFLTVPAESKPLGSDVSSIDESNCQGDRSVWGKRVVRRAYDSLPHCSYWLRQACVTNIYHCQAFNLAGFTQNRQEFAMLLMISYI